MVACSSTTGGKAVRKTLDTMDESQRESVFEATSKALDSRPELVDELYAVTRRHPVTFNRFLANAARDLADPELARTTGELLSRHPKSLEQVLLATLDQSQDKPDSRAAIARAMQKRQVLVASIQTDSPSAVHAVMNRTIQQLPSKPGSQEALLRSMRESADQIAAILAKDPKTVTVLMEALLDEGVAPDVVKESFGRLLGKK
jgi:hypothetical protein